MTGFHEVRFPDNIAYGATGGPEFATTVVATSAGHEKRNVNWAEARGRPVGVAIDRRGALLVADDVGNRIWRVAAANPVMSDARR